MPIYIYILHISLLLIEQNTITSFKFNQTTLPKRSLNLSIFASKPSCWGLNFSHSESIHVATLQLVLSLATTSLRIHFLHAQGQSNDDKIKQVPTQLAKHDGEASDHWNKQLREFSIDFPVRCQKHASLTISCHTTMILVASHVDCSCNFFNLKSNRGMYIFCKQHEKQRKNKTQIVTVLGAKRAGFQHQHLEVGPTLPRYSLSGPRKKPPNPKAFNFKQTSCTEKT